MKKRLSAILLLSSWSVAFATSNVSGVISTVRVDSTGHGMIFFSTTISSSPSCINSTYYSNAYAFDSNTDGGKAVFAWALSAKAAGSSVVAYGLGGCNIYGSGTAEDISYGSG